MTTLSSIRRQLEALGKRMPPMAGAVLIDPPLTSERWQFMLDVEARLLAYGGPLDAQAQDILRMMPAIRDARQRLAEAEAGKQFEPEYGIDMKAELAAEAEVQS